MTFLFNKYQSLHLAVSTNDVTSDGASLAHVTPTGRMEDEDPGMGSNEGANKPKF